MWIQLKMINTSRNFLIFFMVPINLNFDTNKSIAVVNRQIYSSIIREICQKMPVSQIKNSYIRSYYELVIEGQTVTVEQSVYQHIVKLEQMVEEYVKLVQNIKQNKI